MIGALLLLEVCASINLMQNHYSHVPLIGKTKAWFVQDIKTIKHSAGITAKRAPLVGQITTVVTCVGYLFLSPVFNVAEFGMYLVVFVPIAILAFFLLHVMKTKGYDIQYN